MWVYGENMQNMNHKSLFGRWGGSEKSLLCCNSDDHDVQRCKVFGCRSFARECGVVRRCHVFTGAADE